MNYRSIADLARTIRENLYKLPRDIEFIVGCQRSGMLAASMLALYLNLKITDVNGFLSDSPFQKGRTRVSRFPDLMKPSDASHVLVVDDSINSGDSLLRIKELIEKTGRNLKITYCVIYAAPRSINLVDVYFEVVPLLRLFEWNVLHRSFLSKCCVDIDGVIFMDPTKEENDDGDAYKSFLVNARPLVIPSYSIGNLVTSRLEKYRQETEEWLKIHGILYDCLHMLNLPDADTRRRLGCHASFKADVYRKISDARLFIESEPRQAIEIANISGKLTLCFSTQQLFRPGFSYAFIENKAVTFSKRVKRKILSLLNSTTMP
jgi:uncharacterized HAD superfamily protein/adenine/guanine phosphoribosyltransferase-like PRPP-binding protein